jgi:hypothetical protein
VCIEGPSLGCDLAAIIYQHIVLPALLAWSTRSTPGKNLPLFDDNLFAK